MLCRLFAWLHTPLNLQTGSAAAGLRDLYKASGALSDVQEESKASEGDLKNPLLRG